MVPCITAFNYLTNHQRYQEAAQHILDALVLQDSDGLRKSENDRGVTPNVLWDSLKTCCLHMQRADLAVICEKENLEGPLTYRQGCKGIRVILTH
jgi:peroxin-5